jgi:hypothetical protein
MINDYPLQDNFRIGQIRFDLRTNILYVVAGLEERGVISHIVSSKSIVIKIGETWNLDRRAASNDIILDG